MFAALGRHHVAYVVIGGMAAALWGSDLPRTTDVDITPAAWLQPWPTWARA
jgi:hypothetical protein